MAVPGALACLRLVLQSLCDFFPPSDKKQEEEKEKNYAGSENHSPHQLATLVPSTVKLLHRKKEREINGDQEGCRLGLTPAPDES